MAVDPLLVGGLVLAGAATLFYVGILVIGLNQPKKKDYDNSSDARR